MAAIVVALVAAPGACEKGSSEPREQRTQPPAVAPGAVVRILTLDGTEACPDDYQFKFVGTVRDPNGVPVSRPLQMKINQFNVEGDPGTILDGGTEKPGAGYSRTGRSPLAHCLKANPGDFIHAVATFTIQTNAVGWKVSCVAKLSEVFPLDQDEDSIEGSGIQEASATCEFSATAP